jgi:large subunit ribosomal protein L9
MKIIFLKDVPRVGRAYQVKEVSDGYALNFLFPKKLAEKATPEKLQAYEAKRAQSEALSAKANAAWESERAALDYTTISIKAKANEKGSLYQGIDAERIAQEIQLSLKILVPSDAVKLPHTIKEVGEYSVVVSKGGRDATVSVTVVEE